jgi:DNA-binding transcriptional regulator YiaG
MDTTENEKDLEQQDKDRARNEKEMARKCSERRINGRDMKKIRERCGYSAREFAELLQSMGARITTTRSVYRLEERRDIPPRYVDALTKLVGVKNFAAIVRAIIEEEEELARWREEMRRKHEEEERQQEERRLERRRQRIA